MHFPNISVLFIIIICLYISRTGHFKNRFVIGEEISHKHHSTGSCLSLSESNEIIVIVITIVITVNCGQKCTFSDVCTFVCYVKKNSERMCCDKTCWLNEFEMKHRKNKYFCFFVFF